ncbi:MAG: polyisoprenoid-binding protein YceI, partial [Candidatus Paceibacteria bacterium]
AATPSKSSVEITIKTGSVDSNSKKRDEHLLSPDFLDAKQFPEMTFKSSEISQSGETWHATGILAFHGTRKEVSLDFEKTGEGGKLMGFHTQFTIDRTEWGIDYGTGALGKEIEIIVSLEVASQ